MYWQRQSELQQHLALLKPKEDRDLAAEFEEADGSKFSQILAHA